MLLGNLGNILAVALAFIGVMLLLSLVVTGIASGLKCLLRLRSRATHSGLVDYLRAELHLPPKEAQSAAWEQLGDFTDPKRRNALWVGLIRLIRGPRSQLVGVDTLKALAQKHAPKADPPTTTHLQRLNAMISARLTLAMRWVSVFCALAVAGSFQVNAPDLLGDLSIDAELRKKAVELSTELVKQGEDITAVQSNVKLRAIDIQLWGEGWAYYTKPIKNRTGQEHFPISHLFGVLVTAVLITFGAPFWYQQLKRVSALKDSFTSQLRLEAQGKAP